MNNKLMTPFRAPREAKERTKEPDTDSEEPTEWGLVWPRNVIKETQEAVADNKEMAKDNDGTHECSQVQFPCLSEFEAFLEQCDAKRKQFSKNASNHESSCKEAVEEKVLPVLSARQRTDAYWENVLQSEKRRLAELIEARTINVDDICFDVCSDDDDVPIVFTLPPKSSNLSVLANVASTKHGKKKPKTLWTYETIAEPTGVVSKYWDSPAPLERFDRQRVGIKNL
jgi:hypothetical protein